MEEDRIDTKLVHSGEKPCPLTRALRVPVYMTSTFVYENFDELMKGRYFYTRIQNPTLEVLEEKLAEIEGGERALVTASGMAAITIAVMSCLEKDGRVVTSDIIYGGTHDLFTKILPRLGFEVSYVDFGDISRLEEELKRGASVVYFESPANPTMKVIDIEEVSKVAHEAGVTVLFDNTFATPYCQQPLRLGVDVNIESLTKYLSGHGDALGGAVIGRRDYILNLRGTWSTIFGATMSPLNAWLVLRGVKTLHVRMERHCRNAMALAEFLEDHPKVKRVLYPGLPSHPQHEIAKKQMRCFGGMLSFEVENTTIAMNVMNNLRMSYIGVSLGDVETLVEWPACMTHMTMPRKERRKLGITDTLIRVSVGLEDPDDIIEDFDQALSQA